MKKEKIIGIAACVCVAGALTCTDNTIAGNGTRTGNPMIAGVLYNQNGSRAAHAKVKFIPADHNPRQGLPKALAMLDSTITDDTGHYAIDSLPSHTYNAFFSGGNDLAFRDSITVREGYHITMDSVTLKTPGSLHGRIRMQSGDDPRTVSILFIGTTVWSVPDDSTGTFTVANVAEGDYRVRFLSTLDSYTPKDTTLHVTAGKIDSLANAIVLQYSGIPVPDGLRASYDTLHQSVTLFWNRPTTGRQIKSYHVYRRHQDSTGFTSLKNGIIDTAYADSTGIQDQIYEYKVAAIDMNESEGVKSQGIFIRIASYLSIDTLFSQCINAHLGGGLEGYCSFIAADGSGSVYVVDRSNRIVQIFDTNFVFIRQLSDTFTVHRPVGVATGADGRVFIADVGNDYSSGYISDICMFNQSGALEKKISVYGTEQKGLNLTAVWYFTVDSKNRVILSALKGQRLVMCDTAGTILHQYDGNKEGEGKFGLLSSLAIDQMDNIYVANSNSTEIYIFDTTLTFLRKFGINGKNVSAGSVSGGMAIEPQTNRIFKVNYLGNRLDVFDTNGNLLSFYSFTPYGWCGPADIFIKGNRPYVALSNICKIARLRNAIP
jgi:DNA-binding beta-propeller fold protein YncE